MKKNLMSVIILALVFANFVLTAILMFTVIPQTKKANNLIDQVCEAVSLDLNSGASTSTANLPQDQIVDYALNEEDKTLTINFAPSEDETQHYLVCGVSLSLNKESDGYKTYGEDLSSKKNIILADINTIIGKHTMEDFNNDKDAVYNEILKALQDKFGADYIVGVNFTSSLTQ